MAGNVHDRLIACTAFREIRDKRVPVIVPPSRHLGVFADISPCGLEGRDGSRGIGRPRPPKREDILLRPRCAKLLFVPDGVLP